MGLFKRALSVDEVRSWMENGLTGEENRLSAYYPLNEAAATGRNYLEFNDNGYVTIDGLNDDLQTNETMTFACWFNTTYSSGDAWRNQIFSAHDASGGNRIQFGIASNGGVDLRLNGSAGQVNQTRGSGYNDGNWHFISLQVSGSGVVTVKVDGSEITGFTTNKIDWNTTERYSIGMEWDGDGMGDYFDGYIDEVSVYERLLSSSELTDLMNAGPDTSEAALIAYYDFDENGYPEDLSGRGNHGNSWANLIYRSAIDDMSANDNVTTSRGSVYRTTAEGTDASGALLT
jgi:hypothetical protein